MIKKNKYLLADDDPDDRSFFTAALVQLDPDAEIITVNDGKLAIEWLSRCGTEHLPCAMIIDYNMPNLQAPEVLEWMQGRSWFDEINRFVWSTSGYDEYRLLCKRFGATDYFVKPVHEADMNRLIQKIICHSTDTN